MARIVFMGSPDFAVPSLRALAAAGHEIVAVVTQPDREGGRGRRLLPPAVKTAALALGLPVLQPPTLRRPEVVAELTALAPDLIVVAAYGQILRPTVLAIPQHGVLNVHASLLPRWRGASPVAAAIAAGDDIAGVSIMLMDEGLDTGPVLAVCETPITARDTGGTLTERLAVLGAELLAETVPRWLAGAITPRPQDDARATYAPRLEKSAGRINWHEPAAVIWRKVRAYTPWPGAYTEYEGEPLRITAAWPLTQTVTGEPGHVVSLPPGAERVVPSDLGRPAFAVITGDGLLAPLTLQRAGRRALPAAEFLRGERGLIGRRLGDAAG
jgi:methionyl-tRNA formyltransferase